MPAVPRQRPRPGMPARVPAFVLAAFALLPGAGPEPSGLPRLPALWSHPPLRNFQSQENPASIHEGIFLGLDPGAAWYGKALTTEDLVALDLEHGKELWRRTYPGGNGNEWTLAGNLVLVTVLDTARKPSGSPTKHGPRPHRTLALDLRTGKPRWTRTLPRFERSLMVWRGADREIGLGDCHRDRGFLAVDLITGDSLWRIDGGPAAVGRDGFYQAASGKNQVRLLALDPVTGKVRRSFSPPIREARSLHVFGPHSDRAWLAGHDILALSLEDGRILWQVNQHVPFVPILGYRPSPPPRTEWRGGRLFLVEVRPARGGGRIRELSLGTGREIGSFVLPPGLNIDSPRMHILAQPGGRGLTLVPGGHSSELIAFRYSRPGAEPRPFALGGRVMASRDESIVSMADAGNRTFRLEAYPAFDGDE